MPDSATQDRPELPSRRDQILEETLRIVGQRGYHGFGLSELAERCGLTKAGLLHHFGSKEQLLISTLERWVAKETAELSGLFLPAYASAERSERRRLFRGTMRTVMARAVAAPELMRLGVVLRAEAVNSGHPAHAFFQMRQRENVARIAGRLRDLYSRPESVARQILALQGGLEEQWLREDGGFDMLSEWEYAIEQLLDRDA